MTAVYTVRRFPSATGYMFFQVMSPLGHRVYESTEYAKAAEECERRNHEINYVPGSLRAENPR